MKNNKIFLFLLLLSGFHAVIAQSPKQYSSSDIYLKLKKLNVLGNVLYVAAHPDDENTRVIAYMSNGALVNAAYLSMTRGDGGQNLIGPEIREQLGIVRTQELLAARRIDGGQQFFTRANDFGYSKNAEETQRIWQRSKVLGDVVWTFRKFRPDIVILRFPPDERAGHGHHTTSAILAEEAFKLAGDRDAYPDQLKYVEPWQPKKIFMNTGRWWNTSISADDEGVVVVDVGEYSAPLGISLSEMAAISRSQHKSQGFGATGSRGEQIEYLEYMSGIDNDEIFEGIDMSWNRVQGGKMVEKKVSDIINAFDINAPARSIPLLIALKKDVNNIDNDFWRKKKLGEIDELVKACAGLYLEAVAEEYNVVPGQTVKVRLEITNRSEAIVTLDSFQFSASSAPQIKEITINANKPENIDSEFIVSDSQPISNPYWLNKKGSLGMYAVDDQQMIGKPENDPAFNVTLHFSINNSNISYEIPVIFKWNDRVKGEQRRRVEVTPPVMVSMNDPVLIFPDNSPKDVDVKILAGINNLVSSVSLRVPDTWRVEPEEQSVSMVAKGDEKIVSFKVYPPQNPEEGTIVVEAKVDGKTYSSGRKLISYDHIPIQTLFPEANSKLVRLNIEKEGTVIGYVQGAGDAVPQSLEAIGYTVWEMKLEDLTKENLGTLDAVIMGVRAANTHPDLKNYKDVLLDFVYNGGNLIYQYNTTRRISWEDFAPYELGFTGRSSDSRVSVEEAEIRILRPDHMVLNSPNKITGKDFDGWVQERGLYFPSKWSNEYEAILSSNDPGEDPKDGGLLIAKYGKGYYVYTGYSWFRELPAGVPGAYRLFANIVSLGKEKQPAAVKLNTDN